MSNDPTIPPNPPGEEPTRIVAHETDVDLPETHVTPGAAQPNAPAAAVEAPTAATPPPAPRKGGSSIDQKFSGSSAKDLDLSGESVGGYDIVKMLGHGGMGAVCLARQRSLDREVALKILPGRMATNPDFLARFTREALSAAQLTHHNIIQVYDIGNEANVHFISMEFVEGEDLGKMVRRDGKFTAEDAAAYILQAARGLHYAHRRGVIHRDIKPDNIMLNTHGVVKIADMGLAKMVGEIEAAETLSVSEAMRAQQQSPAEQNLAKARGDLTIASVAMGTPAYMPPEQGRDASRVDHRADQYSLGCTLYFLLAGKTPYHGKTAMEIISKHQVEPLPPISAHVRGVPDELNAILERTLQKNPEDRYPSMAELIKDLEAYLGVETVAGEYRPREEHLLELERRAKEFAEAPALMERKATVAAFYGGLSAAFLLSLPFSFLLAGLVLGLVVLTTAAHFVINGTVTRDYLFRRVRAVFFGMTPKGWLVVLGNTAVALAVLWLIGWLWVWVGMAVVAGGLAIAYQVVVARKLRAQRGGAIGELERMLKTLRVRGVSEEGLQDFVCRFGGERWEELFEALFGYEAMIAWRGRTARMDVVRKRRRFAPWRDPLHRWLTAWEDARRRDRERRQLARAEAERLKAEGVSESDAHRQADQIAAKDMEEGLLKETAILESAAPEVGTKPSDKYYASDGRKAGPGLGAMLGWGLRFVRFGLGAAMAGAYAVPAFSPNLLVNIPEGLLGLAGSFLFIDVDPGPVITPYALPNMAAMVAGVALLLTAFSRRVFFPGVALLGALLAAGCKVIAAVAPDGNITAQRLLAGGVLLAIVGLGMTVMAGLFGRK